MRFILALVLLAALGLPAAGTAQQVIVPAAPTPAPDESAAQRDRLARAGRNLTLLRSGELSVAALTPQELQDMVDLERALRGGAFDTRTLAQRCVDAEVQRVGGRPSRLEWEVIRLKCR